MHGSLDIILIIKDQTIFNGMDISMSLFSLLTVSKTRLYPYIYRVYKLRALVSCVCVTIRVRQKDIEAIHVRNDVGKKLCLMKCYVNTMKNHVA